MNALSVFIRFSTRFFSLPSHSTLLKRCEWVENYLFSFLTCFLFPFASFALNVAQTMWLSAKWFISVGLPSFHSISSRIEFLCTEHCLNDVSERKTISFCFIRFFHAFSFLVHFLCTEHCSNDAIEHRMDSFCFSRVFLVFIRFFHFFSSRIVFLFTEHCSNDAIQHRMISFCFQSFFPCVFFSRCLPLHWTLLNWCEWAQNDFFFVRRDNLANDQWAFHWFFFSCILVHFLWTKRC